MKRVTIKDIAKISGYSANCVSRALKDADDISVPTKEKIRQLAREMGYIPNTGAASLRSGTSHTIGIVCDNLVNPFYTIMMDYIRGAFAEENYRFITFYAGSACCTAEEIRQAVSSNVAGLLSFLTLDEEATRLVDSLHLPLVVLGRSVPGHDCFIIDGFKGGFFATEYLINRGLKKICYWGDAPDIDCSIDRGRGYSAAVKGHGLQEYTFYVHPGDAPDVSIRQMLDAAGVPEGVFCFNDVMAYHLREELEKQGIRGVQIVGFDNLHHEMPYCSRIPTVGYNKAALGTAAARRLIARIRGVANGPATYTEDIYLEATDCGGQANE